MESFEAGSTNFTAFNLGVICALSEGSELRASAVPGLLAKSREEVRAQVAQWLGCEAAPRILLILPHSVKNKVAVVEDLSSGQRNVTVVERLQRTQVLQCMIDAEKSGHSLCVMCPSGQTRAATAAALWLHHKHLISPEEAVRQVARLKPIRRPNLRELEALLCGHEKHEWTREGDSGAAWATPRTAQKITPRQMLSGRTHAPDGAEEVLFLCTGGTIDKDYPRLVAGYAFEIGDPAVQGFLKRMRELQAISFAYSIVSVCRKDSQHVDNEDRRTVAQHCLASTAQRIIVTHGTDTIVETAEYILDCLTKSNSLPKVVVLTGALRPEKFAQTDAHLNLGCALGAAWANAGKMQVLLAMNGRVLDVSKGVTRHPVSGHFQYKE